MAVTCSRCNAPLPLWDDCDRGTRESLKAHGIVPICTRCLRKEWIEEGPRLRRGAKDEPGWRTDEARS